MHPVLVRILKQGIPVAVILAVIGYVMAEAAGMLVGGPGEASVRVPTGGADGAEVEQDVTRALRSQMPLTLAAWGFGIVVAVELVRAALRGTRATRPAAPQPPSEDSVETLLNQLLQQAEAAEAARAAQPLTQAQNETPPPTDAVTPCPAPAPAENSPVTN